MVLNLIILADMWLCVSHMKYNSEFNCLESYVTMISLFFEFYGEAGVSMVQMIQYMRTHWCHGVHYFFVLMVLILC